VAAILGIDPYTTPLQLWKEMVQGEEKQETSAMRRGKELEPQALEWLNVEVNPINQDYFPFEPKVLQSIEYPDLICSLDGFRKLPTGEVQIAEIKHPNFTIVEMAQMGKIPEWYLAQMQFQMWMTDLNWCWYVVGQPYVKLLVNRDDKFLEEMIPKVLAFKASIIDFDPPEPCDMDWVEIDDPEKLQQAKRYAKIGEEIERLEQEKKELRKELINEDFPLMKVGDLKIQMISSGGRVNWKELCKKEEISQETQEKYRGDATISWRFYE
jgi:putative phage-type endonuclease